MAFVPKTRDARYQPGIAAISPILKRLCAIYLILPYRLAECPRLAPNLADRDDGGDPIDPSLLSQR
jgi:hypothetical protein